MKGVDLFLSGLSKFPCEVSMVTLWYVNKKHGSNMKMNSNLSSSGEKNKEKLKEKIHNHRLMMDRAIGNLYIKRKK